MSSWYIASTHHEGVRGDIKGCIDETVSEAMARRLESEAKLRRRGIVDPRTDQVAAAAEQGPVVLKQSGTVRAARYRPAAGTSFRAGELPSLTHEGFDLDADRLSVTV